MTSEEDAFSQKVNCYTDLKMTGDIYISANGNEFCPPALGLFSRVGMAG